MSNSIQIYVACLSAYNNGYLHGEWIDAVQDADSILEDIQIMLEASPMNAQGEVCEEWAIHDSKGFGKVSISESEDLETVSTLANFIYSNDEAGLVFLENCDYDIDSLEDEFSESFCGKYESKADYAESFYRECYPPIPDSLKFYINWESMAQDWEYSGDFQFVEQSYNQVFVFRRN